MPLDYGHCRGRLGDESSLYCSSSYDTNEEFWSLYSSILGDLIFVVVEDYIDFWFYFWISSKHIVLLIFVICSFLASRALVLAAFRGRIQRQRQPQQQHNININENIMIWWQQQRNNICFDFVC